MVKIVIVAIGCIIIGFSNLKKGLSDNGQMSKKVKYFNIIFGGFMILLGLLNILSLL